MSFDTPPAVSVKHLTHRFGKVTALDDLSLDIPSGIIMGMIWICLNL